MAPVKTVRFFLHCATFGKSCRIFSVQSPAVQVQTFGNIPSNSRKLLVAAVQVFFPPNVWPEEAPLLQPRMESMYQRLTGVAEALLQVFAIALEAPPDFFRDKVNRHHSNMQVRHAALVLPFLPYCMVSEAQQ